MTTVFVLDCGSFEGANLCNYLIQHTTHYVVGFCHLEASKKLSHLETAISSKSRFAIHFLNKPETLLSGLESIKPFDMAYKFYGPEVVISPYYNYNKYLRSIASNTKIITWQDKHQEDHTSSFDQPNRLDISFPYLFGPREKVNIGIASICYSVLHEDYKKVFSIQEEEFLYIKDFFSVIETNIAMFKNGGLKISSGFFSSERNIQEFLYSVAKGEPTALVDRFQPIESEVWQPKFKLSDALEHTLNWYSMNSWIENI